MKLKLIFVFLTLTLVAKGFWLAAAVQPVLLSLGAVLTVLNQDALDIQPIEMKNWLPFAKKSKKYEETPPIVLTEQDLIDLEEDENHEVEDKSMVNPEFNPDKVDPMTPEKRKEMDEVIKQGIDRVVSKGDYIDDEEFNKID